MFHTRLLRKRMLLGISGLLLASSAAWADPTGYVDCAGHPDETQVYAKARRTTDVVASVSCGEGFTVLLNGFIFSRIQTSDGRVGYIFSNLITPGRAPGSVQARNAAPRPAADSTPQVQASAERVKSTQVEAAPATMREAIRAPKSSAETARATSRRAEVETKTVAAAPEAAAVTPSATSSTTSTPVETKTEAAAIPAADRAALEAKAEAALSTPAAAPAQVPAAASASSEPAAATTTTGLFTPPAPAPETPAITSAEPLPNTSEAGSASAQPSAAPEPEAVQPAKPIEKVRPEERWERPNAGGRRTQPLVDFYGGYAFVRAVSAGSSTNLNGFMGSAAWNVKPWMQLIADSSYNVTTISGVKNVLYGNHWGPRVFLRGFGLKGHRGPGRWGLTPFAEALVGGSRADTSVSGATAYSTSDNSFSFKVGGGVDVHQSRHLEIRLLDVDYYRTGFGGLHQNNYWATAGIVIRVFGGGDE